MISWIYRVIPHGRGIILLGAFCTNLSAVLVESTVFHYTKNRRVSLYTLVLAEILMAMTWRAFIVYTDNYGMIFVALIVWVYLLEMKDRYKIPCIIILAAMGTFVKATIFISMPAAFVHKYLMLWRGDEKTSDKVRKIISVLIIIFSVFGLMFFVQKSYRNYHGLNLTGHYPKGWQYIVYGWSE